MSSINYQEQQVDGSESLINKMRIDVRNINLSLTEQFQRFQISYNRIMGNELFGKT